MSCRLLFEKLSADGCVSERADLIDTSHPSAACEVESVSVHSLGPVQDEEYLHRYVFSPLHIHEGKVVSALFSDAKNKGLSCERDCSPDPSVESHRSGEAQVQEFNTRRKPAQPERTYVGIVTAQSGEVRKVVLGEKRVYAVYDTGLPDNPAHVDVFEMPSVMRAAMKSEQKLIRLALAEAFSEEPIAP